MQGYVVLKCHTCPQKLRVKIEEWHGLPPGWKAIRSYWLCPVCWKRYKRGPKIAERRKGKR